MQNRDLAKDYLRRSDARLKALDVLFAEQSWADVVREAQEIVELALKAVLRSHGIEAPRVHDVSEVLIAQSSRLPAAIHERIPTLAQISKNLRRDRELAFYGSEDLTPLSFYSRDDASKARDDARLTVDTVRPHIK
ncbi:HEPN domain-containing protein [bacterium]|nr:HEPN domain-containing protein [bacterium]